MSTADSMPWFHSAGQQLAERGDPELVHLVVHELQLLGGLDVAIADDPDDAGTISSATVAIRSIVGRASCGHGHLGDPQPGDLGDVHAQVAHPLELADHPQRRDDGAQVAGHGLLEGEQEERRVLDLLGRPVDLAVLGDDGLGNLGVAGQQGPARVVDGRADLCGDGRQVVEEGVELFVVGLAHDPGP